MILRTRKVTASALTVLLVPPLFFGLACVAARSTRVYASPIVAPAQFAPGMGSGIIVAAPIPPTVDASTLHACPAGMVRAAGEHCSDAELKCLRWLDPPPYQNLRCAEYAEPSICRGKRTPMSFCIDQEEHGESAGSGTGAADPLPRVNISYLEAKSVCASEGKRLCREQEWEFACEGVEMRPYPYGFSRQSSACNIDRTGLGGRDGKLKDLRAPASAYPLCMSPFGVHNMTGNADEWVERDGPHRSVLRGGWWLPGRNRCRAATAEHGEGYAASQVGFRCCSDG